MPLVREIKAAGEGFTKSQLLSGRKEKERKKSKRDCKCCKILRIACDCCLLPTYLLSDHERGRGRQRGPGESILTVGSSRPVYRTTMASDYDFIVVGGMFCNRMKGFFQVLTDSPAGPSGCALAARLAQSAKRPSVLLLEAGSSNAGAEYLVPADRFTLAFKEQDMNWGYKTVPQTHLKGQEIDYSRGRGLGGSTAINVSVFYLSEEGEGKGRRCEDVG